MSKKDLKKNILIFAAIFVVNYILLYVLSATKLIFDINSPWTNHLFIIAFFIFGYLIFEYFKKEIDFNFAEIYIGLILLIMLYLGYYMAYWIYYTQTSGIFSSLLSTPYIHIAVSFFMGWLTFFFMNFNSKN